MKENIEKIKMIKNEYIPLINKFLSSEISAWDFAQQYFKTMKDDPTTSYNPETFSILQAIFEDCDAYWPTPDPNEPWEIGEDELRRCCQRNLEKLKEIVNKATTQLEG
jgi:hypothetical protein